MTKNDALRRLFCLCSTATNSSSSTTATKKRLSTSLRDDLPNPNPSHNQELDDEDSVSSAGTASTTVSTTTAAPRSSRSMVIGTIFGQRRGHVWFCIQQDRLSTKPFLLLELSIQTQQLVKEMNCGLVRIALESESDRAELSSCPLRSIPVWALYCNGRKLGFAARRKGSDPIRLILKTMQSTTVGAGVIPAGFGSSETEEIMYMRANYEHVVGSADSESFHLINPDDCPSQELSVFLLRSK